MNRRNKLRKVAVSYENYISLKKLEGAGDSFNDVIILLLKRVGQEEIL